MTTDEHIAERLDRMDRVVSECFELMQQMNEVVERLKKGVHGFEDRISEVRRDLGARIDACAIDVQVAAASVDALRADLMRRTLNGLADTEPPPKSGPEDETPPHGRKAPTQ